MSTSLMLLTNNNKIPHNELLEPQQLRRPPAEAVAVRRGGAALRSVTVRPHKEALRIDPQGGNAYVA